MAFYSQNRTVCWECFQAHPPACEQGKSLHYQSPGVSPKSRFSRVQSAGKPQVLRVLLLKPDSPMTWSQLDYRPLLIVQSRATALFVVNLNTETLRWPRSREVSVGNVNSRSIQFARRWCEQWDRVLSRGLGDAPPGLRGRTATENAQYI